NRRIVAPGGALVVAAEEAQHVPLRAVLLQGEEQGAMGADADDVARCRKRQGVTAADGRDGPKSEQQCERKHGKPSWVSALSSKIGMRSRANIPGREALHPRRAGDRLLLLRHWFRAPLRRR